MIVFIFFNIVCSIDRIVAMIAPELNMFLITTFMISFVVIVDIIIFYAFVTMITLELIGLI